MKSCDTFEEWRQRYNVALGDHTYLIDADLEQAKNDYHRCLLPEHVAAADIEFVNSGSKKDAEATTQ